MAVFEIVQVAGVPNMALAFPVSSQASIGRLVDEARRHFELRCTKQDMFGADLFSDTGWDIMLLLCINSQSSLGLTARQLSDSLNVAVGTIDRYLKTLGDKGLVAPAKIMSHDGGRRVRLSTNAMSLMSTTLLPAHDG